MKYMPPYWPSSTEPPVVGAVVEVVVEAVVEAVEAAVEEYPHQDHPKPPDKMYLH
jgi:uncharacterized protein (DUF362 family)